MGVALRHELGPCWPDRRSYAAGGGSSSIALATLRHRVAATVGLEKVLRVTRVAEREARHLGGGRARPIRKLKSRRT
jgi:hypothetical protein